MIRIDAARQSGCIRIRAIMRGPFRVASLQAYVAKIRNDNERPLRVRSNHRFPRESVMMCQTRQRLSATLVVPLEEEAGYLAATCFCGTRFRFLIESPGRFQSDTFCSRRGTSRFWEKRHLCSASFSSRAEFRSGLRKHTDPFLLLWNAFATVANGPPPSLSCLGGR